MNPSDYPSQVGEICRFQGHSQWVQSVAFSPDGRSVLSGGGQPPGGSKAQSDFTVRLWDVQAGIEHFVKAALGSWVLAADQVPEASASQFGERRRLVGHSDQVTGVAFLADGRLCLSCSYDGTIRLWDLESGRELRYLVGHADRVLAIAVNADGRLALSGGCDGRLRLWDLEHGREAHCYPEHKRWVMSVAFSLDGRLALSGGLDGGARLWEVAGRREARARSPGGLLVTLWAALRHHRPPRLAGHAQAVTGAAFHPAGRWVLTAGMDRTLRLWDIESGQQVRHFSGHEMGVTSVALSADGRRALSGSLDRSVRLWDVESGQELQRFTGHTDVVSSVAFSPDGCLALSGGADTTVRLWRLSDSSE